jgi:hypothetical protein
VNCKVHKARQVREVMDECGFIEIEHPPCSPDLAPSGIISFLNLKKKTRAVFFFFDEYPKEAVEEFF